MTASDAMSVLDILRPTGYRLLVRVPEIPEKTRGGIVMPQEARAAEQTASCVAEVVAVGETAYLDFEKFPRGPWCQVGDHIIMRTYSGTKFKVDGQEYRLINDDTVEAVVSEPDRVKRM
jgi:chaperonin GroES